MKELNENHLHIDSYIEFWGLSGVEYGFEGATSNWFELSKQVNVAQQNSPPKRYFEAAEVKLPAHELPKSSFVSQDQWPDNLETLQSQIATGVAFPGNTHGRKIAVPSGTMNPLLMIVGDLPEIDDIEAGSLKDGGTGRIATAMAKAAGIAADQIYYIALATTRPGTGALPDEHKVHLLAFFRHCLAVVKPQALLVLGPAAAQMLFDADFMTLRGNLQNINHDGGNVAAVTTFHPRTLMSNPALKAAAWQDLQMLAKKGQM